MKTLKEKRFNLTNNGSNQNKPFSSFCIANYRNYFLYFIINTWIVIMFNCFSWLLIAVNAWNKNWIESNRIEPTTEYTKSKKRNMYNLLAYVSHSYFNFYFFSIFQSSWFCWNFSISFGSLSEPRRQSSAQTFAVEIKIRNKNHSKTSRNRKRKLVQLKLVTNGRSILFFSFFAYICFAHIHNMYVYWHGTRHRLFVNAFHGLHI